MPSKIKASAVPISSAGFLKPTYSSLRKAVDGKPAQDEVKNPKHGGNKKSKVEHDNRISQERNGQIHVPIMTQTSSSHSSRSSSVSNGSPKLTIKRDSQSETAPLVINEVSPSKVTMLTVPLPAASAINTNEEQIADAQKICDDLREQIDQLKLQQKQFTSRINDDLIDENIDGNDEVKDGNGASLRECQNCEDDTEENGVDIVCSTPIRILNGNKSNGELKGHEGKDIKPKSSTSEDSFTLHGSVTSSDMNEVCLKDDWPSYRGLSKDAPPKKVIKRLVSEREHYKRKVKHLQNALHRLKKQSLASMSLSPDIAAHDIVYFNADLIGEGHMSYVFSGNIYKDQPAAIKKLIRPDMMSTSDRSYLAAEAGLLMTLHHRNIVEVFGVSTAPLQPLIVAELVKGKNLNDKLHSTDAWPLSPVEYYSICRDVAVGMAYLHGQKPPVLHLNLRPCNILLEANGCAKVADFGFSKIRLDAGVSNRANLAYLAPELLQFPVHLTTKLDVFSFSVIMWEMATLKIPYQDLHSSEIFDLVSRGKRLGIPTELPSGFHAIISRCWDQSPMQRPSFKELIVLLETMTLPTAWEDAIRISSIVRTDTKGLITPKDSRSTISMPQDCRKSQSKEATSMRDCELNARKDRKKVSDDLALENDMISMGYAMPKQDAYRNGSSYLNGFQRDTVVQQHYSSPNTHKSTPKKPVYQSPNRRNILRMSPSTSSKHISYSPMTYYPRGRHSLNGIHESKAARNLNPELSSPQSNGHHYCAHLNVLNDPPAADGRNDYDHQRYPNKGGDHSTPPQKPHRVISRESTSSAESIPAQNVGKKKNHPEPLTDRDLRFVDQDLTVGTPKVITGRSLRKMANSKPTEIISPNGYSNEDLRAAVSIPYLKNLRSGDEESTGTSLNSQRSQFDEKLNTFVHDACEAESRNDVHGRYRGWDSARSNILNRERTVSSSDQINVKSIATSAADRIFAENRKGPQSSVPTAWSESAESLMTAVYKPNDAQRRQLKGQGSKTANENQDEFNSSTTSDNSIDDFRKIGVLSIPSTVGVNTTSKHRHTSSDPKDPTSKQRPPKHPPRHPVQRSKSWNKLKNSYSPEPLMPAHAGSEHTQGTPPNTRAHFPLPPSLSPIQIREKYSAFARPVPVKYRSNSLEESKNRKKKPSRRKEKHDRSIEYTRPLREDGERQNPEDARNMAPRDEVGATLRETAAELVGVSQVLNDAAEIRERNVREKKKKVM